MSAVTELADEYWATLKRHEPYYAVVAGELPERIETVDEDVITARAAEADRFRRRLDALTPAEDEADLASVLAVSLAHEIDTPGQMWHVHPGAPYQAYEFGLLAAHVVAPQQGETRQRLTGEFAARIRSVAGLIREQGRRGIVLPAPAVPGARATWTGLRTQLPAQLDSDEVESACGQVLEAINAAADGAGAAVGLAQLPGGEPVYRAWVTRETTMDVTPEQLHRLGLEQCAELAEHLAEIRSRLGGPADDDEARDWVKAQPRLYASTPDEVVATYRRHIARVEPALASLFRTLPSAGYDVRRVDPAAEAGMTFGYYQPPTMDEPLGLYRFNGSALEDRLQVTAAAVILHELVPGHHFHIARQGENTALHPLQRHTMILGAFNEGWGEYASGLGWEMGAYDDDWDAYGRLAHERFTAQRLVVDTALNLGWWDLARACAFMRANTLESNPQINTETLRYSTDLPAQALAYRSGFQAFREARESASGVDVRDIHEAMLGGGAVPLPRMRQRVSALVGD